jgi:surfactin synthase thioesterase subunit
LFGQSLGAAVALEVARGQPAGALIEAITHRGRSGSETGIVDGLVLE